MSGLFQLEPGAAASAPLATGPEAGPLEVAGASLDAEAIRTDAFNLMGRRRGARLARVFEAIPDEERREFRIEQRLTPDDLITMRAGGTNPRIEAAIPRIFERVGRLNDEGSGSFANLPKSMDEIEEAVAREVLDELFAAERTLGRGSGSFLGQTVPEFLGGAVGGLSAPDVPLALLGGSGSLARRVLIEAGLGAAGEAASLPRQFRQAEELGLPEPSPTLQVGAGAAFAAGLPVAGRAIAAGGGQAARLSRRALLAASRRRAAKFNPEQRAALDEVEKEEAAARANPGLSEPEFDAARAQAETALAADAGPAAMPQTAQPPAAVRPRILPPRKRSDTASRIIAHESGNDPEAANPNSSALGLGQFTEGRWLELIEKHRPDVAEGRSREAVLSLRTDPELAREMVERQVEDARRFLGANDLPLHDGAVFLAHFAGFGGARKILSADPATPIGKLMSRAEIEANAAISYNGKRFSEFTAADLDAWARSRMGLASGNIDEYPLADRVHEFDPTEIRVDAETFQFKEADPFGVTGRLEGERVWDPDAAMGVMVFERADGTRFIADGHQRLALANRMRAAGQTAPDGSPIMLEGHLFREVDGWTPEMLRLKAAVKNIRQESGTPLDAAKVIRDNPELRRTLNVGRTFLAQADALGRLTPENFLAVVNDVIDPAHGAVIGRAMPGDAELQAEAIRVLGRARPENIAQAEHMVREVRRLGLERREAGAQGSLFGDAFEGRESAVLDRARVMEGALRELRGDQKLLKRVNSARGTLEEAGNVIEEAENARRAAENARVVETIQILAGEPGPVRDALDAAGRSVTRGGPRRQAVAEFVAAVREAVERGDLERVVGRDDPARLPDADRAGGRQTADAIEAELERGPDGAPPDRADPTPERFADPELGPGARDETAVLEAELDETLAELDQLGLELSLDDGVSVSPRQLRQEFDADAEFQQQLDLCPPGRAT